MEELKIKNLLNLDETIAKEIFRNVEYPWEVLPKISELIIKLGNSLNKEKYNQIEENIWVAKNAKIAKTACIMAPCIIDEEAEIRHSAYIRGNAIIGKGAVVGNSTELKNVILFNKVQVPHYNYVGDSILGYRAHMGAGSICSNVRSDKNQVTIKYKDKKIPTNLKKFGAILGDFTEIGCGTILNPGTIIGKNTRIYPLSSVKSYIEPNSIYKSQNEITRVT